MLLHDVPARAAESTRPVHCAPAVGVKNLLPARQVVLLQPLSHAHLGADIGGQLSLDEVAHQCAKRLFFGRVLQIHADTSIPSLWHPALMDAGPKATID